MADVTIVHDPGRRQYQAVLDGEVVAFTRYRREPGRVVFLHTETRPEFEGRGIGSDLARGALDDVRAGGETVVPRCPFIRDFIERHSGYADLVQPSVDS